MITDKFTQQTTQALLAVKKEARIAELRPTTIPRRHAAPMAPSVRRTGTLLPFMRHSGMKGKDKERKEAKHLKPALEPVNENMRNDTMELEGIMSNFGEEDEDENDLPISPGDFNLQISCTLSADSPNSRSAGGSGWQSHANGTRLNSASASMLTSRVGSAYTSRSASRLGGLGALTQGTLAALMDADNPLPFQPFCQKCTPLRPCDCLCLKPDSLGPKKIDVSPQSFTIVHTDAGVAENVFAAAGSRRRSVGKRTSALGPLEPYADGVFKENPRQWTNKLEALALPARQKHSMFDGCRAQEGDDRRMSSLCTDEDRPPVLHRLTRWEVSRLECWAIQHVKKQYLDVCVLAHAQAPTMTSQHRENMHNVTICQLVRKANKKELDEIEWAFMIAKLSHVPLLRDLPKGMLEQYAELLDVRTFSRGAVVFERADEIDGIYILVQGHAEVVASDNMALGAGGQSVKAAPSVILLEDVVQKVPKRPFLLKPLDDLDERLRTRTVKAWDDDSASSLAMFLWLPLDVIVQASHYWRKKEARERVDLICKRFAPALRLDKNICEKHCGLFEIESFPKNYAILQQGSKPTMEQARLGMIVEGEVRLVWRDRRPLGSPKKSPVNSKDIVGPGKVLGESALYGEPFPHYAMVSTETVQVLTLKVVDFFEKLLARPAVPLDKPLICAGTLLFKDQENMIDNCEKGEYRVKVDNTKRSNLIYESQQELRVASDKAAVQAKEWKTLSSKCMVKVRKPPACGPLKAISALSDAHDASHFAPTDLGYPRDLDLFPSAQRSMLASQCNASVSSLGDGSTTVPSSAHITSTSSFAPDTSSDEWMFASIDQQIKKKLVVAEELELEHHLHKVLGAYMEDVDRPRTSATGVLRPVRRRHAVGPLASLGRPNTTPSTGSQGYINVAPARSAILLTYCSVKALL